MAEAPPLPPSSSAREGEEAARVAEVCRLCMNAIEAAERAGETHCEIDSDQWPLFAAQYMFEEALHKLTDNGRRQYRWQLLEDQSTADTQTVHRYYVYIDWTPTDKPRPQPPHKMI